MIVVLAKRNLGFLDRNKIEYKEFVGVHNTIESIVIKVKDSEFERLCQKLDESKIIKYSFAFWYLEKFINKRRP